MRGLLIVLLAVSSVTMTVADPIPKFLQGDWDAVVLTPEVPIDQIRRLLDPGFDLKPQNFTSKGTHPLILLFSNQTNVHTTPAIIDISQYYEYILVLPWLVRKGDTSLKTYSTSLVLYLDSAMAVLGGNLGWSIPKVYEEVSWIKNYFQVNRLLSGRQIMNVTYKQLSNEFKPYNAYPNLQAFQQLMSQEIIQPTEIFADEIHKRSLAYECFTYNSQITTVATFAPVTAELFVNEEYLPHAPIGQFSFDSITQSAIGAFRMKTHWFLSAPFNFC